MDQGSQQLMQESQCPPGVPYCRPRAYAKETSLMDRLKAGVSLLSVRIRRKN